MRSLPATRSSNFTVALYFLFKMLPALGGIFAIYLGYRLFILGVTGQASLSLNSQSVSGQLLNAAPGLFFAIGGVVILFMVVLKSAELHFTPGEEHYRKAGHMPE